MEIDSPETLIKCLKMRRHYYIEVRDHPLGGNFKRYECMLCDEVAIDVNSLLDHLKSRGHKKNLNFAKLTLLKRGINRWPFNDGVMLFDSSIKEKEMSFLEKREKFKNDPEGFNTLQNCLRSIDEDDELSIENFEYEPIMNPRVEAYSGSFLIPYHGDTLKIGKAQIHRRYDSNTAIEKIWCEWIGKDENDYTSNEVNLEEDDLIRVVIMRYRDGLGVENSYCGICNQENLVGRDVASLLEPPLSSFGNIVCCSSKAIYKSKGRSRSRFHSFHVSCLIKWILWCEYAKRVEVKDVTDIYYLFCPGCHSTDESGGEYYKKSEMDMVKSLIVQANNEWKKNPELLQNASIGLHFPLQSEDTKKVEFLKLVQFYRAEYEIPDFPTKVEAAMN